jgi:threonine dehydratase
MSNFVSDLQTPITREGIAATEAAIRSHVRRTPVVRADANEFGLTPGKLFFKLETLQHSGSFKARGAFACETCRPSAWPQLRAAITAWPLHLPPDSSGYQPLSSCR